jgi:hypothetical protein
MKSIRRLSGIGLAAAVVVLGGCASAPTTKASSHSKDCINTNQINSITALDDQHLFVRVSASQHQLFTVDPPCNGLRLARAIRIADAATRVCSGGTTLIAFSNPAVGDVRCRVRWLDPVADKAEALELIEERASREE